MEERIAGLERRCRVLTACLVALMCGAIGIAAQSPATHKNVTTQELTVVDENGNSRIRLGGHDDGFGMQVFDSKNNEWCRVGENRAASYGLEVFGHGSAGYANIYSSEGVAGLLFHGQDESCRVRILAANKGKPSGITVETIEGGKTVIRRLD